MSSACPSASFLLLAFSPHYPLFSWSTPAYTRTCSASSWFICFCACVRVCVSQPPPTRAARWRRSIQCRTFDPPSLLIRYSFSFLVLMFLCSTHFHPLGCVCVHLTYQSEEQGWKRWVNEVGGSYIRRPNLVILFSLIFFFCLIASFPSLL